MADCFVSYATEDREFAERIVAELKKNGVKPFVAYDSIKCGDRWCETILDSLRESEWVIYLASKAAANSAYVQQEIGGAILANKILIPVIWECRPEDLPGWSKNYQAIDMREDSHEEVQNKIESLAKRIPVEAGWGEVLGAALAIGFAAFIGNAVLPEQEV